MVRGILDLKLLKQQAVFSINFMSSQKNIVFDLGGVLFEQNQVEIGNSKKLFSPIEAGVALLEECYTCAQKAGHKLYVCTNLSMGYIDMLEQDYPHIFAMFDGIVTPTVAQAKKPDVKIFNYLLDTYELVPHHSIFIDDQIGNVEAARQVGMSAIHVCDFMQVRAELSKIGVLS